MIRVALADAHQVVREGLQSILERAPDVVVVGSFGEGTTLIEALPGCVPDVVVMEGQLPDGHGAEWAREIRRASPETRIVILTAAHSKADLVLALEAGVDGYLRKDDSADSLKIAVRVAQRGQFYVGPTAAREVRNLAVSTDERAFTPRELDVLVGVGQGLTTKEIAAQLCLSPSTVKTHLASAYRKLGARNRIEAMQEAIKRGVVARD